jgi:RHS repeat-associated protein
MLNKKPKMAGRPKKKYTYDQLNRIKSMAGLIRHDNQSTTASGYSSNYSYDANGNLQTLQRYAHDGSTSVLMDDFEYHYNSGNNQLNGLKDLAGPSLFGDRDIDDATMDSGNYSYDEIGRLISDVDEGIDEIHWTVTNKVKEIEYTSGKRIVFDYNPMGNRIAKKVYQNTTLLSATFYALDAQGNTMNVYTFDEDDEKLYLSERNIYGSSRIGQERLKQEMTLNPPGNGSNYMAMNESGDKYYELSNHLGNVLTVISDRKIPVDSNTDGTVDYYEANIISYSDYYPFGSLMPGRHGSVTETRYGFNGMEADDEISGEGNSYDFGARMYNPRVGRFLSLDAYASSLHSLSPYNFASNSPVFKLDPDGNWDIEVHAYNDRAKYGYAILIVKNNSGDIIYQTTVRVNGTKNLIGKARNITNGDTPQGDYKILEWRKTDNSRYPRLSYGPNDLLALEYRGGEGGSRQHMHIHGGRQEAIDGYKPGKNLANTFGCIRIKDRDILQMKKITTELERNDPTEKKGMLTLKDDLIEVNGQYVVGAPFSAEIQQIDEVNISATRAEPVRKITRAAQPIETNKNLEIISNESNE